MSNPAKIPYISQGRLAPLDVAQQYLAPPDTAVTNITAIPQISYPASYANKYAGDSATSESTKATQAPQYKNEYGKTATQVSQYKNKYGEVNSDSNVSQHKNKYAAANSVQANVSPYKNKYGDAAKTSDIGTSDSDTKPEDDQAVSQPTNKYTNRYSSK